MRTLLGRTLPVLLAVLLTAAGCGSRDPRSKPLSARLKSLAGLGRPDLSADEVQQALDRQLRVAPVPATGGRNKANPVFPTRETLTEFYARHEDRLAWCDDSGGVLPRAKGFLDALRRAGEHGLDPEDYALNRLDSLVERVGKGPLDEAAVARLADFDLLMTAAFFRYASDLSTGRVHPDEVRDDWHTNPPELDFVAELDRAIEKDDLEKLLEALPPPHRGYTLLREALKSLREVEAAGGWPKIPDGPTLEPGSRGPRVALLRQRLSAAPAKRGIAAAGSAGGDDVFDGTLAEAVRVFQERNGIEPDGKVSAETLGALNTSVDRRVRDVELNLERWRWVPRRLGDPHVLVNIPAFSLEVVRGGEPVWHTRIVVGKAYTSTPVFSDQIVSVVANPPWNVPESIAVKEYLPELRKDPKALAREGLRLLEGTGKDAREVDPKDVDWDDLKEGSFPYHLRQDPGADSALGRLKFDLTNEFNIYLHDTPARSLFGRSGRDLSHGCIRVEKPLDLAKELLDDSTWEQLREALEQPEERHLAVKPPVPVHILYFTAWVDEAGVLRFQQDVYELDGPQRTAIERVASRIKGGPATGPKEPTQPPSR
jgi:L,D-transpeptidase YcbB